MLRSFHYALLVLSCGLQIGFAAAASEPSRPVQPSHVDDISHQPPLLVANQIIADQDFSRADLQGARFHKVHFKRCRFDACRGADSEWQSVRFDDCVGTGMEWAGARLNDCVITKSTFDRASWHKAHLCEVTFDACNLQTTSWAFCSLENVLWSGCHLHDSMWHQPHLQQCRWIDCDLSQSVWWATQLTGNLAETCLLQDSSWVETPRPHWPTCLFGSSPRPRLLLPWRSDRVSPYLTDLRLCLQKAGAVVISSNMEDPRVADAQLHSEVQAALGSYGPSQGVSRAQWIVQQHSTPIHHLKRSSLHWIQGVDGLILPGGPDLEPELYGQIRLAFTSTSPSWVRTIHECCLLSCAQNQSLPVLGVCRGMQLLNVFEGGGMAQHIQPLRPVLHSLIPHRVTPTMSWRPGGWGLLASPLSYQFHHQACCPLAQSFDLMCTDGAFPQVILHRHKHWLGVQFHPEVVVRAQPSNLQAAWNRPFPPLLKDYTRHPEAHLRSLAPWSPESTRSPLPLFDVHVALFQDWLAALLNCRRAPIAFLLSDSASSCHSPANR